MYSNITKQNSEILKQCVMSKSDPLYREYGGYHTGVDITGDSVYALYSGTIVLVNEDTSGMCVILHVDSEFCLSYKHIDTVTVHSGDEVSQGDKIGDVTKYVHVELLTYEPSIWPVRIGSETWYKHDITQLLSSGYMRSNAPQFSSMRIVELSDYPSGSADVISDYSRFVLSNNKG